MGIGTIPVLLCASPESVTPTKFSIVANDNEYISNLSIVTMVPGSADIRGLSITLSSTENDFTKVHHVGQRHGCLTSTGSINLTKHDHIIEVSSTERTINECNITTSLSFVTSNGNEFGHYGTRSTPYFPPIMKTVDDRFKELHNMRESLPSDKELPPLHTVLVGVSGTTVRLNQGIWDMGCDVLSEISFLFRVMLPSPDLIINNSLQHEPFSTGDDCEQLELLETRVEMNQEQMLLEMSEYEAIEEIPEHFQ